MTIHTQPIIIDPASIVAIGAMKAGRCGRPKKGVVVEDAGKVRAFKISDTAHAAVASAALALGVSESAVIEGLARSLSGHFQGI